MRPTHRSFAASLAASAFLFALAGCSETTPQASTPFGGGWCEEHNSFVAECVHSVDHTTPAPTVAAAEPTTSGKRRIGSEVRLTAAAAVVHVHSSPRPAPVRIPRPRPTR
jgi:hypothetical protein